MIVCASGFGDSKPHHDSQLTTSTAKVTNFLHPRRVSKQSRRVPKDAAAASVVMENQPLLAELPVEDPVRGLLASPGGLDDELLVLLEASKPALEIGG